MPLKHVMEKDTNIGVGGRKRLVAQFEYLTHLEFAWKEEARRSVRIKPSGDGQNIQRKE